MAGFLKWVKNSYRYLRRQFNRVRYIHIPIFLEKRRLATYTDGVIEVLPGARPKTTRKYVLFVLYPSDDAIDNSVLRAFDALNRADVNILVLANVKLGEKALSQIRDKVWRIVHRRNIGFDFGAYKDGVKYLAAERPDAERVLLMNDSVFYASPGLDDFIARLLDGADAISAFENWGEGYHMQSFAVGVSGEAFRHPAFQSFWKSYLPVNNRIHAIESGEKKLSDALLRAAKSSCVIYSVAELTQRMQNDASGELVEDYIIPMQWRKLINSNAQGELQPRAEFRIADKYLTLADAVNATSTIHSGAFLFPYFMKCPIYKKDLVYRQRFQFWELSKLTEKTMPPNEHVEFMLMLRQRGDHKRLPRKILRQYEIGVK